MLVGCGAEGARPLHTAPRHPSEQPHASPSAQRRLGTSPESLAMIARSSGSLAFAALVTSSIASAQCANTFQTFHLPGITSVATATSWDPDGSGPLTARVVFGGSFRSAGDVAARNVVAWDPATATSSPIGTGITAPSTYVNATLALPNGELVVGCGDWYPGAPGDRLWRWNGVAWTPFGGTFATGGLAPSSGVNALARMPNGDLAVGGAFAGAGSTPLQRVGIWNGTAWSDLGGGMNGAVRDLAVAPNGDLIAAGEFTLAGGVAATGIARWNGTTWSSLGSGLTKNGGADPGSGFALEVLPNGDIVVGGGFTAAGGAPAENVARWNGTTWSGLASGIATTAASLVAVHELTSLPNGDLLAGGVFTQAGGQPANGIARWDGGTWSAFGAGVAVSSIQPGTVTAIVPLPNGELVVGGGFTKAGAVVACGVARWDGANWSAMAAGNATSGRIKDLLPMPDGSVVAIGSFSTAGDLVANQIARWDGVSWSTFGSGFPFTGSDSPRLNTVLRDSSGGIVVAGDTFVSRWDGTTWTQLGGSFSGAGPHPQGVLALAEMPNGDLLAGGDFHTYGAASFQAPVARWDGTSWTPVGGQWSGTVEALAVLANGDLIVGGDLGVSQPSGTAIARWDGTTWSELGGGLHVSWTIGRASRIEVLANGDLLVAGGFTVAGGQPARNIARWNGTSWSPLGAGLGGAVWALHELPNGDVLAGGWLASVGNPNVIVRWNGAVWSDAGTVVAADVNAFAALGNGDVLIGGDLAGIDNAPTANLVQMTTTCPATVQGTGAGCAGDALTASLPWTGGTWRAEASNLPPASFVFAVSGFAAAALPLTAVFPTAIPGCTLHVQPDHVELLLGGNGAASLQFVFPNTPVLAGITFHHQMVPIALDATLAVTATNALQLTVGSF